MDQKHTHNENTQLANLLHQNNIINKKLLMQNLEVCQQKNLNLGQFLVQNKLLSTNDLLKITKWMHANKNQQQRHKNFGKYIIIEELARGGMGIVYKAKSPNIERILVLKTLLKNVGDPIAIKRFCKEAQTIASLHHQNIVELYDYGEESGRPFFTMQYVEGMDFQQFIDKTNDRKSCLKILAQIARALDYAHKQGVVHRDVKPSNILLDLNYKPYLADFGLVKWQDKMSSLTEIGSVVGTPLYLSPEQVKGNKRRVNKSADIYALGVMLYKVLTNKYPFVAENLSSLYIKILEEPPISCKKRTPDVPSRLDFICMKAISKKTQDRHKTALEFAQAIEKFLSQPQESIGIESIVLSTKMWCKNVQKNIVHLFSRKFFLLYSIAISCILAFLVTTIMHKSNNSNKRNEQDLLIRYIKKKQYGVATKKLAKITSIITKNEYLYYSTLIAYGLENDQALEMYQKISSRSLQSSFLKGKLLRAHVKEGGDGKVTGNKLKKREI